MISGTTSTWMMNRRGMIVPSPGKFPPKRNVARYEPTIGIDSTIENMIRSPVPDTRSSGSEYPMNPLVRARMSRVIADHPVELAAACGRPR